MLKIKADNEVTLRLVSSYDANFILSLRLDPELNKHISTVSGNLEEQISFLEEYKKREQKGLEYYFIIEYKQNPVGTVRIYDINKENKTYTWGSWIIKRGNPGFVALSSAYMTYGFAFDNLNLEKALIDVRKDNLKVFNFHRMYAEIIREDDVDYFLELKREDFSKFISLFTRKLPNKIEILNE